MRIGISARGLSIPSGGARQFIQSLIPALARQKDQDGLFVFYNRREFLGLAPSCDELFVEEGNKLWWDFVRLPRAVRRLNLDAMIFPKNVIPFGVGCKSFPVIHDLAYFDRQLNAYPVPDTMYMRMLVPRSVRKAAAVFAVSENTKSDIIRYTGCSRDKVVVAYEAADENYRCITDQGILQQVRNKYDLPEQFALYTGSLSPRKNAIRLLKAFGRICEKIPHSLVLTGSKSWNDAAVYREMKELPLPERVRQLGYVEPEDMPVLYNLAGVYVYPSLYEGFGLPVLEAMQCGCPVVASNTTSIPEVAGNAALLVDPLDIDAIANAMNSVLTDSSVREKLISLGHQRARVFSWDKCADTILTTIRKSVGNTT